MKNEFVSYEIALALKELGFDEPCLIYWVFDGVKITFSTSHNKSGWSMIGFKNNQMIKKAGLCTAPTFSQAFRWFREKCSIQATIEPTKDQHRFELGFNYWIWNTKTAEEWFTEPRDRPAGDYVFDTYREAELECLKKLISIVKEQNGKK